MDATLDKAEPGQVVILGFGRVGRMVADMLESHGKDYLAIDSDVDGVAASRKEGYDVLFGDVSRPGLIEQLRERQPSAFILTMDNPVLAGRLARNHRGCFPRPADRRPRPRHRPRRRAVQGRSHRRGARNARSLAPARRSRAGRPRRRDGPGDRLDPREARRAARRDQGRSGDGRSAAARRAKAKGCSA